MNQNKMSSLSRLMIALASICLIASIFVPIWRIELAAPQYPEGLAMLIYADKLGGDVEIINGLNHYIGMQTLHAENFIEFTLLRYLIGFFALFSFFVVIMGRKKILYVLLTAFVLFGIIAMIDFWRWEYNYGHNLDPKAAIIVPGMAYQPPLIGFKQLLNFGAYSIPDMGGWLFVSSGLLMLLATLSETNFFARFKKLKSKILGIVIITITFISACGSSKPEPIVLNKDNCDFCKMSIADGRFGAELITSKGRTYKFDDLSCMLSYKKENSQIKYLSFFVHDYMKSNILIPAETAFFVVSEELNSPMGGNTAAFNNKKDAENYGLKRDAMIGDWKAINK